MFSGLSDMSKAGIFTALVLVMATAAALIIRVLHMPAGPVTAAIYMFVPAVATLIMLLVITKDGYSTAGWKSLGLHRAGLKVWGVAVLAPLMVGVVGTAFVWATPLATFVVPPHMGGVVIALLVQVVAYTVTYSLGEELGWRGYLLPRLIQLGRTPALVLVGLVWAAWHLPMILLTPLYHADGNRWIVLPLFVATILAGSFVFGYLRLRTGSVWPAALAHTVHNVSWGTLTLFTTTTSPVLVDEYLVGDNGILILAGTVLVAVWLRWRWFGSAEPTRPSQEAQPTSAGVEV